jgi:hypothetical protein
MAGEWLKMECATPDKPEVLALTVKMGWDDPDLTVGKLFRLWRWFDQQTTDGNAHGVSAALLDKQVGVSGFIQALSEVGWVDFDSDGVRLLGFEKHNGATAKSRAQTAKRVANFKSNGEGNAKGNAVSVSEALARVEKSREENKEEGKADASPIGSRLPTDWVMNDEYREFCLQTRPDLNPEIVASQFADYWHGVPGSKGRKANWLATWRNWVREQRSPNSSFAKSAPNITVAVNKDIARTSAMLAADAAIPRHGPSLEVLAQMAKLRQGIAA